jgi:hypothetical protein
MTNRLVLATAAILIATSGPAKADTSLSLASCSAEVDKKGQWRLNFLMRNSGAARVRIPSSSLPWGVRSNVEIVAIPLREEAHQIPEVFFIDDPREESVEVPAGETISGSVNVSQRFPKLSATVLGGSAVLIGWKARASGATTNAVQGAALLEGLAGRCVTF